jgi:hypothetical protein
MQMTKSNATARANRKKGNTNRGEQKKLLTEIKV